MTDNIDAAPAAAGQADVKPWFDGADPETVGYIQNKGWDKESPLKAVEGYRNLEKFHGVPADQIIKMPKEGDTDAWNNVYSRLGRPESPDKYGMDSIKLPEGAELDSENIGYFDSIFHKAGISKAQRDAILNEYVGFEHKRTSELSTKFEQEKTIQVEALKKEWGAHYDERTELSKRAFKAFLPEGVNKDEVAAAFEASVGPAIAAKMFANLADKLGEDKFHDDGNSGGDRKFGYTREQATADRATLMSELKSDRTRLDAYNRGSGLDYDKMARLNKIISGA